MKLGIIKKDKSKVEIESQIFNIIETRSFISIEYDKMDGTDKLPIFTIEKKDIQLIYFGGWKCL